MWHCGQSKDNYIWDVDYFLPDGREAFQRDSVNADRGLDFQTIRTYAELMRQKGWYQTTSGDIWAVCDADDVNNLPSTARYSLVAAATRMDAFYMAHQASLLKR